MNPEALIILVFLSPFILATGITAYAIAIMPLVRFLRLLKGINPSQREILDNYFPYYNNLNSDQKKEFERRLKYFLLDKEFIGRKMPEVTEEMKTLVGACAVQITFGYKPLKLSNFPQIILYPSQYYSRYTKKNHRGEVNANGIIVLSWEHFLKGYKIPNDGFNLGLHEMAHALKLEDAISQEEFAFIDHDDLNDFYKKSTVEFKKIRLGEKSFIRKYAAINREEFFAVCIEQFFEQPAEFKEALPELYLSLCQLLKQDPLNMDSLSA
ncbi:MAG TPA: zinc-dependent peptidase [Cytophagaceae bacterium]|jgi:Mlc titration factor MtfA (ptsG expression regulator)|nr:zinc-dependent peptidase [Cytophagaceae bacterium]